MKRCAQGLTIDVIQILEELNESITHFHSGPLLFGSHFAGVRERADDDCCDGGVRSVSSGVGNNGGRERPSPQKCEFSARNLLRAESLGV